MQCAHVQDTADLLSVAGLRTLALIDELGKSTSSTDGIALAWATAEELLATKTLALFATHFRELARLPAMYATASAHHMEAVEDGNCYKLTHKCVPGPCTSAQYGIKLAQKV